jgi:hypothetical protein
MKLPYLRARRICPTLLVCLLAPSVSIQGGHESVSPRSSSAEHGRVSIAAKLLIQNLQAESMGTRGLTAFDCQIAKASSCFQSLTKHRKTHRSAGATPLAIIQPPIWIFTSSASLLEACTDVKKYLSARPSLPLGCSHHDVHTTMTNQSCTVGQGYSFIA